MRDGKLYLQLGYADFAGYCTDAVGIKDSQANNYIRVMDIFGSNHPVGRIGVAKLTLLSRLGETVREEFMSTPHEVNGQQKTVEEMSKRELERVIKEKKAIEEHANSLASENSKLRQTNKEITCLLCKGRFFYAVHNVGI